MRVVRGKKGSALALSASLAFVLVVVCLGFFILSLYFGGERETKNASDSGALNVGREVATYAVQLQGGDEQQFSDVADSGTNVSLKNINRVWGKALLCAINAAQMTTEGTVGSGANDAHSMHDAAETISNRLASLLDKPSNLKQWYLDFAQANSTRMLGVDSVVDAPNLSQWSQSYMDRGYESNLQISSAQLPVNYDPSQIKTVTNAKDPTHTYLAGYNDYNILGMDFWQVPFRLSERPHLVARSIFDNNQPSQTPLSWTPTPVPNAFSLVGSTINNARAGQSTTSWVQTNPQQTYPLAIPDGFIRVKLEANTLQWCPNGIPYYSESYGFMPGESTSDPFPLPCGSMSATEFTGLEYTAGPTLFNGIFAQPPIPPTQSNAFSYLFQRVQEMHPGYSQSAFIAKLVATPISTDASDQEFVIYNSSFDPTSSDIIIAPSSAAPSWVSGDADGSQQTLETEGPLSPNQGYTDLTCYGEWIYPSYSSFEGDRMWTPGTGYGGCLGELDIHRTTTVYYFGGCACP